MFSLTPNQNVGLSHTKRRISVLCFCHLRWNFVYQRPQHLLTRAAAHASVYIFEEPLFLDGAIPELRIERRPEGVEILTPLLPSGLGLNEIVDAQRLLLDHWLERSGTESLITWYYTPMALSFSSHLRPETVVYDCMDELSAFQGAPPNLLEKEEQLFEISDVVFAGGQSLFEAKRKQHSNVYLFPSSIDRAHFAKGRIAQEDPEDQASIPHPRIGFFGVLDERLDRELLAEIARLEPSWHFVLIGPVVKIREEDLPQGTNIHYLGQKEYRDLPKYLAKWDVAMLPFAQNASTRFISPTKTPEYLAAGKPVVSTPIHDVADPYGKLGLVSIAGSAEAFCAAIADALEPTKESWIEAVDEFLRHTSWNKTFESMWQEVNRCRTKNLPGPAGRWDEGAVDV